MQQQTPGMTVLILDGPWWSVGKQAQIISATTTHVVLAVHDVVRQETIKLAPEQVIVLDQIAPTTDGPFHSGDTVFIHESAFGQARDRGQVGKVISAFPAWQKCLIRLDEGEEENRKLYDFEAISLITPERRPPDEDYFRAITDAVPRRGYWRRYHEWWQQQADRKLWPIDELPALYAASLEIEAQVKAEIAAEVERQGQLLEQAFRGLTHVQKVEKWQAEWYSWTASRASDNEPTPEEKLLRAIVGESNAEEAQAQPEDHLEVPEEHGRDYGYRNSGSELLERCERHMKRLAQPGGYAYDMVPFRAISAEAAPGAPAISLSQPTLPQAALPLAEPLILPGREQALTLLKEGGEPFTAALASLASTADDVTVAALFEQYAALQAREGFDDMRYLRINNLALALLATQREDVIEAVLKKKLDTKFWGEAEAYRLQGIMFKGSAQPLFWDEQNPWHISMNEAMQTAIARVWAPVMRYAPRFVALLSEYTLGLALFTHKATGACYLGYLHLVPLASYELSKYGVERRVPSDTSITHLLEWLDQGHLCLLLGYPSRDPDHDRVAHLPHFRLPLALRELYAIHSGLDGAVGYNIESPQQVQRLLGWIDEEDKYLLDRFHARTLGLLPDQFVAFASDISGNSSVFDLDCLDERQNPQVADWDHETWKVSRRESFWQWFADFAPRSLLGLDE